MAKKRKQKLKVNDYYVHKLWSNPHQPTALTSLTAFAKARKGVEDLKALERSLSKIPSYSIHRRLLKNYKKPSIIINAVGSCYASDLADMSLLKHYNSNYRFMLVTIDQFSKKISVVLLKNKTAKETVKGLETTMKQLKYVPFSWCMDMGLEFKNSIATAFFKKHDITQYFMTTQRKAAMAENLIKQLKIKIWRNFTLKGTKRYVELVPFLVKNHNSQPHSSHNYIPDKINHNNENEIFSSLYKTVLTRPRPPPVYKLDQHVRLATKRFLFKKYYESNFSEQVFKISEIKDTFPIFTFKIATLDNLPVESSFCAQELSSA